MNIAIIGANGFIGKHLTNKLTSIPGNHIRLFGTSESGSHPDLPYTQLNFSEKHLIQKHFAGIDLVYYLASASIPSSTWNNPLLEIEKNLVPFLKFMEGIVGSTVKKVSFVSSAGTIYGNTSSEVNEESFKNPFSPYGITKLSIEQYLLYYKTKANINYDVFRVSNVYGPGQDTSKGLGIINTFLEQILRDGTITIYGNGENTRNFIYVIDVAEYMTLSLNKSFQSSDIYNLSSNDTLSINELIGIIEKVVPIEFKKIYLESRGSDNPKVSLDNSKIRNTFPNSNFTNITEGVTKTYSYLKGLSLLKKH